MAQHVVRGAGRVDGDRAAQTRSSSPRVDDSDDFGRAPGGGEPAAPTSRPVMLAAPSDLLRLTRYDLRVPPWPAPTAGSMSAHGHAADGAAPLVCVAAPADADSSGGGRSGHGVHLRASARRSERGRASPTARWWCAGPARPQRSAWVGRASRRHAVIALVELAARPPPGDRDPGSRSPVRTAVASDDVRPHLAPAEHWRLATLTGYAGAPAPAVAEREAVQRSGHGQRARGRPGPRRRGVEGAGRHVVAAVGVEEARERLDLVAAGPELELAAAVQRDALRAGSARCDSSSRSSAPEARRLDVQHARGERQRPARRRASAPARRSSAGRRRAPGSPASRRSAWRPRSRRRGSTRRRSR